MYTKKEKYSINFRTLYSVWIVEFVVVVVVV